MVPGPKRHCMHIQLPILPGGIFSWKCHSFTVDCLWPVLGVISYSRTSGAGDEFGIFKKCWGLWCFVHNHFERKYLRWSYSPFGSAWLASQYRTRLLNCPFQVRATSDIKFFCEFHRCDLSSVVFSCYSNRISSNTTSINASCFICG